MTIMAALPIVLGVLAVVGIAAAASKAKAKPTASAPSAPSVPSAPSAPSAQGGSTAPASSVPVNLPLAIVTQVLAAVDPHASADNQSVWLRDNGWPKTADALDKWRAGDISTDQLKAIATAEAAEKASQASSVGQPSATTPKPVGTNTVDAYAQGLMTNPAATDDDLYSYAITSNSRPFVAFAATRLAANADSRAMALTQHLADLGV